MRLPDLRFSLTLLTLLLAGSCALAQVGGNPGYDERPDPDDPDYDPTVDRRAGPQDQRRVAPDTFGVFLYRVDNPNREAAYRDSLLDGFQRFEPDRRADFDYATLGQIGSAAHPLRYTPVHRRGLQVGFRQFDLYQIDGENLNYYRLERPFTYLDYVRGSEQVDGRLRVKFSRNFADGVNLLLDYDKLTQEGRQDQYPNANLRNTNLATAVSVRPPGSRYSGYFSYTANTYDQRQNGGVVDPVVEDEGGVENPQNTVTLLQDTRLRHSYRQLTATQYLQFGGRRDTLTGRERRAFTLRHQLRVDNRRYRISSAAGQGAARDSFYRRRAELFLPDPRGNRSQLGHRILENTLSVSTFRRGRAADRATVQRDVVELGLTHQLHRLRRTEGSVSDSVVTNLLATGRLGLHPNERLSLDVSGQLNVVGQIGDYRIRADGLLDLGRAGKLELGFLNQLYAPDLVQQDYRLNGLPLYRNDFAKTLEARLEGAYTLPVVGVRAGVAYTLLTNYIYYGTDGLPRQAGGVSSVLQLTAERRFAFGNWTLDNRLLLQEADRSVFRLPQLYGEHSLYWRGRLFGVLNVNIGLDARFHTAYRPYYYNPVLQQFQLQDDTEAPFFVQVDPFFAMRVTKFRFFVKYIQANSLVAPDKLLFLAAENPYPDAAVRWGVSWRLLD